MIADSLLPLEPRIGAQPQHVVVGKSRAAERPGKSHFLLRRRVKPESIGALDFHSHILYDMCKYSNPYGTFGAALYLLPLKGEVSREFS